MIPSSRIRKLDRLALIRIRWMRPATVAAAVVLAGLEVTAGAMAAGEPATVEADAYDSHAGEGGIRIHGGPAANRIEVGVAPDGAGYLVRDSAVGVIPGKPLDPSVAMTACRQADPASVQCVRLGRLVWFFGNAGSDTATMDETVRGKALFYGGHGPDELSVAATETWPIVLDGGEGGDVLRGGAAPGRNARDLGFAGDTLRGGKSRDRLRGRRGPDWISGGSGPDVIVGGWGNDRLHAGDGMRDRRIRCGRGRDLALVDSFDPRAKDCERARLVS